MVLPIGLHRNINCVESSRSVSRREMPILRVFTSSSAVVQHLKSCLIVLISMGSSFPTLLSHRYLNFAKEQISSSSLQPYGSEKFPSSIWYHEKLPIIQGVVHYLLSPQFDRHFEHLLGMELFITGWS